MRNIWTAFLMMLPCLFAQGGERCQEVGGAILTNFLPESGTIALLRPNGEPGTKMENFVAVVLGTATGDLRGGVVIFVLASPPTIRVHGNWVTESGDTIYTAENTATPGAPITGSLTDGTMFSVTAAIYKDGLNITGGTGRFKGASGKLKLLFGAGYSDGNSNQFIYRYQGTICFRESQD